jgi:hypothetical protein
MPEDKDFKRIVRARMADTGERYTVARAGLRPEGASDEAAGDVPVLAGVVAMDRAGLDAWRREWPQPVPGVQPTSFGPDWELTVGAGGGLDVLDPPRLEVAAVAALGRVLGGVACMSLGLHMLIPVPPGSDPESPGRPFFMPNEPGLLTPLSQAHAELRAQLGEHLGVDAPAGSGLTTGQLRRHEGFVVVPARSEETVLLGEPGVGGRRGYHLDPSEWPVPAGSAPWAVYGLVLHIQHDFPTRRYPTDPAPGFTGAYHLAPVVDETFWEEAGAALGAAAARVDLPRWPLDHARIRDPVTRTGWAKRWQQPV